MEVVVTKRSLRSEIIIIQNMSHTMTVIPANKG